jgi:diguanylate cyclase (GGDEF)-like protein/PAS domain S-box-containing protein
MPQIIDHRRIINAIIIALALFIFLLTVEGVWNAYQEYLAVQEMAYANEMADGIIAAADTEARERGVTSSTFGSGALADAATVRKILALREKGDAAWKQALLTARRIRSGLDADSEFAEAIKQAEREYTGLLKARQRVDVCLEGKSCGYSSGEWLKDMTGFISISSRLRESAFLMLDTPRHVTQLNLSLKRWVWMASEHAGRERGTLVYYISRRMAVPPVVLDELKANRGVVERSIQDIQLVKSLRNTDPRIRQAIQEMEAHFVERFGGMRQQVYAGAAKGEYPVDGAQWMKTSTAAIDSILAIAAEVTQVTGNYAQQAKQESINNVLRRIALLGITFVLVLWGMAKVRQTANALFKQKELAEVTLHSIGDAVITTNAAAEVEYINPIAEELTGWSLEEAHGKPLAEVIVLVNGVTQEAEPNPVERCLRERQVVGLAGNVVLKTKGGKEHIIEDSAAPILDRKGEIIGAVMVFYDVTQMRHTPHLLSYHATHDALTGLVNRREFERRLAEMLVRAKTLGQQHALCYVDLDQFKVINDTCGHAAGDKLLRQLTYLLQETARDSDTLARLGGDEFGILLENCPLDQALRIADSMRQVIKDFRFAWEGHSFDLGASIGLVPINADSVSPAEVLSEADAACYSAKEKGRNRVQIFQPGNLELARRHGEMRWVARLKEALEQDRFCLH